MGQSTTISDSWRNNISCVIYRWDNVPGDKSSKRHSGAIFRGILSGGNYLWGNFPGAIIQGAIICGAIFCRGYQSSRGQLSVGPFSAGGSNRPEGNFLWGYCPGTLEYILMFNSKLSTNNFFSVNFGFWIWSIQFWRIMVFIVLKLKWSFPVEKSSPSLSHLLGAHIMRSILHFVLVLKWNSPFLHGSLYCVYPTDKWKIQNLIHCYRSDLLLLTLNKLTIVA